MFIKLSQFKEGDFINVCVKKVINGHRGSLGALRMAADTEVIGFLFLAQFRIILIFFDFYMFPLKNQNKVDLNKSDACVHHEEAVP